MDIEDATEVAAQTAFEADTGMAWIGPLRADYDPRPLWRAWARPIATAVVKHLLSRSAGWAVVFDKPNPHLLFGGEGLVYLDRDELYRDYPIGVSDVQRCVLIPVEDNL